MIKQTLFFANPARLSLRNKQIVISPKDLNDEITRPIEDVGCIVLEDQETNITLPLLSELAANNVAVVFCDNKHMPSSMLMPLSSNSTQGESIKWQFAASEPCKKQAWKQIIEAKIRNQAAVLDWCGAGGSVLRQFYQNVKSGDSDNREGLAAKAYWPRLLGAAFKRDSDGEPPNAMLNYGYTILRAATARALLGSGLMPCVGIFHRNRYNAFPLADDVMEAYRPFIDAIVLKLCEEGKTELTTETKSKIIRVLNCDVKMGDMRRPLMIALSMTTASLAKMFAGESKKLTLPEYI